MDKLFKVIEITAFCSPNVLNLFKSVAQSFEEKGQPLWPEGMFTSEWMKQQFADNIVCCSFYENILTGVVFLQREDDTFWSEKPKGEAYYLHKLCVSRDYKGRGISKALMDYAVERAQKDGRKYLRLDCDPRPPLLHLYQDYGFKKIDQKIIDRMVLDHGQIITNFHLARFEMVV